ncbi:2-C-methyl-D-erythritol 4-phosphate cytidylyltransferase [Cryobacterium sp. BB736]|uniref:2-C-methyl-D-erythritol 4-phosphate cytidylyltransferase n=1 Tax=Cryobacterium sp. BB736 TaxID=2746963 RepID=UPI0018768B7C|nr:2-C-methyl-D-erythritol 4-phosphate cytidylyltransferase [Cryobacterium sp. BB736]
MTTAVVVVAAGSGTRLGRGEPKAFVAVGGRSILARALDAVAGMSPTPQIIVVAPEGRLDDARQLCGDIEVTVVAGGATRQQSVAAGLAVLAADVNVVLVHDCARAFTPTRQLESVEAEVRRTGHGVIPGLPVVNTIKQTDAAGRVIRNVDRSDLVAVQTPQGFPRDPLVAAYASATEDFTDDAALFAAAGNEVMVIEGDPLGFKITRPSDLRRAEYETGLPTSVTGLGVDVHAYDESRPLWLGGLHWPDEPGLAGHSDGDAISHAVCDALLSAAGLGDLGSCFGTSDPRFADAHGEVFIAETVALVTAAGYTVSNVAVQLIGNRPKVGARRIELEGRLSALVGAPVRVGATTSDGLGFTGRGEGVSAIATALLHRA